MRGFRPPTTVGRVMTYGIVPRSSTRDIAAGRRAAPPVCRSRPARCEWRSYRPAGVRRPKLETARRDDATLPLGSATAARSSRTTTGDVRGRRVPSGNVAMDAIMSTAPSSRHDSRRRDESSAWAAGIRRITEWSWRRPAHELMGGMKTIQAPFGWTMLAVRLASDAGVVEGAWLESNSGTETSVSSRSTRS